MIKLKLQMHYMVGKVCLFRIIDGYFPFLRVNSKGSVYTLFILFYFHSSFFVPFSKEGEVLLDA